VASISSNFWRRLDAENAGELACGEHAPVAARPEDALWATSKVFEVAKV
jgi:hypothetical protein